MSFKAALHAQRIVLDGALGTQLEETIPRENPLSVKGLPLWSAKVLIQEPSMITKIHQSYLEKGASVLITSLYQASLQTLQKHENMSLEQSRQVWKKSIDCAKDAVKLVNPTSKVFIVASIGPYGAFLANGAEYSGEYGDMSIDKLCEYHREMLEYFAASDDVDCIAFETIPKFEEVKAILKLADEVLSNCRKEFYITLSCKNSAMLADGTPLTDVFTYMLSEDFSKTVRDCFVATGCNCVPFEDVAEFISNANKTAVSLNVEPLTLIVYPNYGFENDMSDVSQYVFKKSSEKWAQAVEKWCLFTNVRGIGGCCSTGPEEVAQICKIVEQHNH